MNQKQMINTAVIAGVVLVVLVIAGLPFEYLGFLVLIVACPLMMFFMMRGMNRGGVESHDHDDDQHTTDSPSDLR